MDSEYNKVISMTDTKQLSDKIDELIVKLDETHNTTSDFYKKVLDKLHSINDENELKELLSIIVTSSKIEDFGGYNKDQGETWNQMRSIANELKNKSN